FGPRPCVHQYSYTTCRSRSASSPKRNSGTFCAIAAGSLYPGPAAIVNAQRSYPPLGEKNLPSYRRTTGGVKMAYRPLVQIVALRGYPSDAHRGAVWVSGRFPIVDPDSVSVGSGIAVRVQDAASLDHTIHWLPEECHPRLRGVLCITRPAEKIQLPVRPGYYGVKLWLPGLPIYAPFQPTVTVTIMQDSDVDRVGTTRDCTLRLKR